MLFRSRSSSDFVIDIDLFVKRYCELTDQEINHVVSMQADFKPESFSIQDLLALLGLKQRLKMVNTPET